MLICDLDKLSAIIMIANIEFVSNILILVMNQSTKSLNFMELS